jgi:hypothetical protein
MDQSQSPPTSIISRYRWIENGHIFLWIIKDTCWAFEFREGGMFMIIPTVFVALYILWRSRYIVTEFVHNIAVCLWLFANSIWMVGEFFGKDTRNYAIILFAIGLVILTTHYIYYFIKGRKPGISGRSKE